MPSLVDLLIVFYILCKQYIRLLREIQHLFCLEGDKSSIFQNQMVTSLCFIFNTDMANSDQPGNECSIYVLCNIIKRCFVILFFIHLLFILFTKLNIFGHKICNKSFRMCHTYINIYIFIYMYVLYATGQEN
jgi:hypothetical protein